MTLTRQLQKLRPTVEQNAVNGPGAPYPGCAIFFSLCNGLDRASVVHVSAADFARAWKAGEEKCKALVRKRRLLVRWLRVDLVYAAEAINVEELKKRLEKTKRNYFRYGLAFDEQFKIAFLEQELNANAMLYGGPTVEHALLNEKNFLVYGRRRFGNQVKLDFSPDAKVYLLATKGFFCSESKEIASLPRADEPCLLATPGLDGGRRRVAELDAEEVLSLVRAGSGFLARQVKKDGRFVYGIFPCFARTIDTYNALRHASSVYAMLEAWEVTGDDALLTAVQRAINYLVEVLVRYYDLPNGQRAAFVVDVGDEIKLGASAVSLLALVKHCELTGEQGYLPLMNALGEGVAYLQEASDGSFRHVLNAADLSLKEKFRIIYYDGEAAFGLLRLYGLTKEPRWLAMVEKAFEYFLANGHWQAHDHWLSYSVNELTRYRPDEKYFRFGVKNIADYLDFILKRETTFPTLLELSMAFAQMLDRLGGHPEREQILEGFDLDKFYRAMHYRAHYLLNGFFWPEMAMYYRQPATIVGSFFIRHHAFRVRIDDVEHYLSGLIAYHKYLISRPLSRG